jgi:hypothetical protein
MKMPGTADFYACAGNERGTQCQIKKFNVKIVAQRLSSLKQNKRFTRKKDSIMSQNAARSAVQPGNRLEGVITGANGKCSRRSAPIAARKPWFLLNPVETDRFTVKNVTNNEVAVNI